MGNHFFLIISDNVLPVFLYVLLIPGKNYKEKPLETIQQKEQA